MAEKGGAGAEEVVAHPGFRLAATMNPGDDLGKRELSPALANRFTTVWVPALEDPEELCEIVTARLQGGSAPLIPAMYWLRRFDDGCCLLLGSTVTSFKAEL